MYDKFFLLRVFFSNGDLKLSEYDVFFLDFVIGVFEDWVKGVVNIKYFYIIEFWDIGFYGFLFL